MTSTSRSSVPRRTPRVSVAVRLERVEELVDGGQRLPAAPTSRSPRSSPARPAGLSSTTPRTSRPSRSGRPTAARMRRAARGGAIATPSRGRLRAGAGGERLGAAAHRGVGGQREDQAALDPDRVEAEQPALGVDQRAARRAARQRRGVLDRAADAPPARPAERAPGRGDEAEGGAQPAPAGVGEREHRRRRSRSRRRARAPTRPARSSPVSTAIAARSRSASAPATRPCSVRPSANVTATSSPRSTCALVRTVPAAVTTPDPRPQPRPRPTTAGPTVSAAVRPRCWSSSSTDTWCSSVSHLQIASRNVAKRRSGLRG